MSLNVQMLWHIVASACLLTSVAAASQVSKNELRGSLTGGTQDIGYFVGSGNVRDGFRGSDPELARWAIEAWQRAIGPSIQFVPQPESSALIRVYWAGPLGGQYGEMRPFMSGDRHGAAVYIRPDTESLGPDIARRAADDALLRDTIVYLTCLHETGHALGLRHTSDFRDIMYFFGYGGDIVRYFGRYRVELHTRDDIKRRAGLSDGDIREVRALFLRP